MLAKSGGPLDNPRLFSTLGVACLLAGSAYDCAVQRGEGDPLDTNCEVGRLAAMAINIARRDTAPA